jgi:hypothetical protein
MVSGAMIVFAQRGVHTGGSGIALVLSWAIPFDFSLRSVPNG